GGWAAGPLLPKPTQQPKRLAVLATPRPAHLLGVPEQPECVDETAPTSRQRERVRPAPTTRPTDWWHAFTLPLRTRRRKMTGGKRRTTLRQAVRRKMSRPVGPADA